MRISINFKVLWDSLGESSIPTGKDLALKSCIHSGNAGDIVYSLPTATELGANHYVINLCSDPGFGGRNIAFLTARALAPLLLSQPYIERVSIVSSNIPLEFLDQPLEGIDFVLDRFRLHEPPKHHLALCHAMAFGVHINLYEKWLHLEVEKSDKEYIILCLTPRYRSMSKEYWMDILSGLDNVIALGLPEEFDCVAGITADFVTCNDFLEMARMIQGCRLFIGNPSLAYAIAEGLKVPRMVELPTEWRNAYPIGRSGYVAPSSIAEARDLIHRLISDSPGIALQQQHITILRKTVDLEATVRDKDTHIGNLEAAIRHKDTHISNLEVAIADKDTHIGNLEHQREENYRDWQANEKNLRAIIDEKQTHIGNLEAGINEKDTHIGSLEAFIREKDGHIANIDATLNNIYNSHGWKALLAYYRLRDKIFPFNTKRRVFAIIVFRVLWNPLAIFRSLKKDNIKRFFYYLKNAGPSALEKKIGKRIFSGKIKIYCDRASMISNTVEVTGWAIAKAGIEKVEIFSDGILLGWASCEHPRHDVHKAFPQIKNSLNSGYFFRTTSDKEFPAGTHMVLIRATSIDGDKAEITEKITVIEHTSAPLPVHKSKQCLRPVRRTVPEEALRFQAGEDELRIELNKIKSELAQALVFKEKNQ
jgi:hypothetical protein